MVLCVSRTRNENLLYLDIEGGHPSPMWVLYSQYIKKLCYLIIPCCNVLRVHTGTGLITNFLVASNNFFFFCSVFIQDCFINSIRSCPQCCCKGSWSRWVITQPIMRKKHSTGLHLEDLMEPFPGYSHWMNFLLMDVWATGAVILFCPVLSCVTMCSCLGCRYASSALYQGFL